MNPIQIVVLICAVIVSALIVWNDLPLEFPGLIAKTLLLFLKLSIVLLLTIIAYIIAGKKKKTS